MRLASLASLVSASAFATASAASPPTTSGTSSSADVSIRANAPTRSSRNAQSAPRPAARSTDGLRYYENPNTLFGVAKRFGLSVSEIAQLNGIKDPGHFRAHGLLLPDTKTTSQLPRYVAWSSAVPRRACAGATNWAFHEASLQSCVRAYCASGTAGERACLCRDDKADITLEVTASSHPSWSNKLELSAFNPLGVSMVDVASVDLDADGVPEILLSWLTGVSNGIAEEWRTFVVLKDNRELLRFDSGAFTAETAAVRVDGQCRLASSHYEEVAHPLRGSALYLVERTFDPLMMRMDATLVGTRFGDAVRYELPFDPRVALVASARTATVPGAPSSGTTPGMTPERGAIVQTRLDARGDLESVSFRGASPTSKAKSFPAHDVRFGDAQARRIFPEGIVWKGLAGHPMTRARSRVEGEPTVLWLDRP